MNESSDKSNTVVDELIIDIYANPVVNGLAILIDRPFKKEVAALALNKKTQNLEFIFADDEKKDLGSPLKDNIMAFFLDREEVNIFQINMETKEAVNGWTVPLTVTE